MKVDGISSLLTSVRRVVEHQEEIKSLRGEHFNIFSVLKMESKENATHSAFLGELLNPKGSHLMGEAFLSLFLKRLGLDQSIDINSSSLILEKYIGSRDDAAKTGGRIDIYLIDAKGISISIENKIYAVDQNAQIERYVNHNKEQNKVYYLTLNGDDASEKSRGDLKEGEHYHCISYKSTIVKWLEDCLKESVEQPILRESIKQYILLIKKLTNQLSDSKMEKEIKELISKDYKAAAIITDNLWKAELSATESFLLEVKTELEKTLTEEWEISIDEDLTQKWTGLEISHKSWGGMMVKLEGASKVPWNTSIYGVPANKDIYDREDVLKQCAEIEHLQESFKISHHWAYYKDIISFNNRNERARLFNSEERQNLIEETTTKLRDLALGCEPLLSKCEKIVKP